MKTVDLMKPWWLASMWKPSPRWRQRPASFWTRRPRDHVLMDVVAEPGAALCWNEPATTQRRLQCNCQLLGNPSAAGHVSSGARKGEGNAGGIRKTGVNYRSDFVSPFSWRHLSLADHRDSRPCGHPSPWLWTVLVSLTHSLTWNSSLPSETEPASRAYLCVDVATRTFVLPFPQQDRLHHKFENRGDRRNSVVNYAA